MDVVLLISLRGAQLGAQSTQCREDFSFYLKGFFLRFSGSVPFLFSSFSLTVPVAESVDEMYCKLCL